MFGPQHLKYIIKYLEGIDFALSQKMRRSYAPDEPALTNELCALLDCKTQEIEKTLSYNLCDLNKDLDSVGDALDFEVSIDTYPHNSSMERYVSQSDFGIILEYENHVLPSTNWSAAYLLQAKKLYRNSKNNEYDKSSRFMSSDTDQHKRIENLNKYLNGHINYILYCPQLLDLTREAQIQMRALHNKNTAQLIYDYGIGLEFRDFLTRNKGINSGVWLTTVDEKPKNLANLHSKSFESALPFTWFIIEHFSQRGFSGAFRGLLQDGPIIARGKGSKNTVVRGIISGDSDIIKKVISEMKEENAPENITIIPKQSITIKVSVGKSLSPDQAQVSFD
ncbi:hypothetical protein [Gluconobacter sp. GP1]|uniref:hypothetical protein n=1 Tax=Gluconobacter sp. GP1 TaxID=3046423 RepID=UPI00293E237C|nr:hypothetical protein [Gluconobacter sp. GP1]